MRPRDHVIGTPEERAATALERLVDLLEAIGDRLELVLEVLPIPARDAEEAHELDTSTPRDRDPVTT